MFPDSFIIKLDGYSIHPLYLFANTNYTTAFICQNPSDFIMGYTIVVVVFCE